MNFWESCHFCNVLVLVLMSLKVFASDLTQLLFVLKLATFLQPLEVLYLHNVYYLKLSFIILIYYSKGEMQQKRLGITVLFFLNSEVRNFGRIYQWFSNFFCCDAFAKVC